MKSLLEQAGYRYNGQAGIWARPSYDGIAYNDGDEIETRLASILSKVQDLSVLSSELRAHCSDWPSHYHFGASRANVLRPFAAALKNADVLEIGAGCGALTRYLGEVGAKVLALEGAERRASIARLRTRDLDNVTVVCERFDQLATDHKFDVVTIIGVLEYAHQFMPGDRPDVGMLRHARSLLKPDGVLILAIENQLGLKYFAGAPEDHVGIAMYGIESRYRDNQPRTYGRVVLQKLLHAAGFETSEFMAAFPDYKHPNSLVTAEGFANPAFNAAALAAQNVARDLQLPREPQFSMELAWSCLMENALGLDMANSFVVVASQDGGAARFGSVLGWHYCARRKASYCKELRFIQAEDGDIVVMSKPLAPAGRDSDTSGLLRWKLAEKTVYIKGQLYSEAFYSIISRNGWRFDEIEAYIADYLRVVQMLVGEGSGLCRPDGGNAISIDMRIPGGFIDLVPQNIVKSSRGKDNYVFFDCEWKWAEEIPLGWLLFRAMYTLATAVTCMGIPEDEDEALTWREFIGRVFSSVSADSESRLSDYIGREESLQWVISGSATSEIGNWLDTRIQSHEILSATGRELVLDRLQQAVRKGDIEIARLQGERDLVCARLHRSICKGDMEIAKLQGERDACRRAYENSLSWRITKPLRGIAELLLVKRFLAWVPVDLLHASWLFIRHPLRFNRLFSLHKLGTLYRHLRLVGWRSCIENINRSMTAPDLPSPQQLQQKVDDYRGAFMAARMASLQGYLQIGEKLAFPVCDGNPVLSIVIVLYNKAELSLACLRSLHRSTYRDYEVVIVDNHSSDATDRLLASLQNVVIIRNSENVHFLRANNQALSKVRGTYLLLLNNDTELAENAIERAVQTIRETPDCGALGAKLVHPDGTLQEAGCIVWRDGSCLGYGRGEDPADLVYNFMRETDYCSGAFLMTHTELFSRHGGFDTRYVPAYYEEADYCLWLQEEGYSVVYDPRVVVHHFEFGSGSSDAGIALQRRNQALFSEKHAMRLISQHDQLHAQLHDARFSQHARKRKRILFIEDRVPHRDQGAGFPRSNLIVQQMVELECQVTVYPINFPVDEVVELIYRDLDPRVEVMDGYGLSCLQSFLAGRPAYYDVVWVSRPHSMAALKNLLPVWAEGARVIYDAEAIFVQREIEQRRILNNEVIDSNACLDLIEQEIKQACGANAVVTVSENDAKKFREFGFSRLHVLGHFVDIKPTPAGYAERTGLLFVGNLDYDSTPNADSLVWFVKNVWPTLKRELPDLTLDIVGSCESVLVRGLASENIHVHGRVKNCEPFFNRARLFIAPTRFSSGIPLKIIEAAAFGVPIVATTLLADQLGWTPDVELWAVEADPIRFSEAVIRAYHDKSEWERVKESALQKIRSELSQKIFVKKLSHALQIGSARGVEHS
jgi:GT2 family glycosyltransferase/2-polyprenyl-3-methyl-5-hydroxy-6-metoxy-1,4-benzoquinol methylase